MYYQLEAVDPDQFNWGNHPDPLDTIRQQVELDDYCRHLGTEDEVGPEVCRAANCRRLRISLSVFCREHHLAHLQRIALLPIRSGSSADELP